jgi:hypothetical protein
MQAVEHYSKYGTPTFTTNDGPTDRTKCALIADRPATFPVYGAEVRSCALAAEVSTRDGRKC